MSTSILRVLVADDEPLARWAVARALASHGHDVVTAATREEACARLFQLRFDVAILASPLDGQDMTDVLRELARYRSATRLVALSDAELDGPESDEPSAWICLRKPFELDTLLHIVRHTPIEPRTA